MRLIELLRQLNLTGFQNLSGLIQHAGKLFRQLNLTGFQNLSGLIQHVGKLFNACS
jgi:hypothetical protein